MKNKPSVLLTEPVFPDVIDLLEKYFDLTTGKRGTFDSESALKDASARYDGMLTMLSNPVTEDVIRAGIPRLKIIANHAVGFNNIDIKAAKKHGVRIANTPDVLTETTADGTLALMLATARRLNEAERSLRSGEFDGWNPTGFIGMDFQGKTLGIIGMGRIGRSLAQKASAIGFKIAYHNRSRLSADDEKSLNAKYISTVDEIARISDILSANCPLTPETHHLINKDIFDMMQPHAILINTSRGPVVDEAALADALHTGKIGGAGVDVYEKEPEVHPDLLTAPNCMLLPHITSATAETRREMGMMAAGALIKVLTGEDHFCNFVV